MSLKKKLLRMKTHLQTEEPKEITPPKQEVATKNEEDAFRELGFEPFYFDNQVSYRKRVMYDYEEGLYDRLHALNFIGIEQHPLAFTEHPSKLLFFDTETTGLSSGAGNMIFLLGYVRAHDTGLEVTQHLLPQPTEEAAFMSGFLDDFLEDDRIVSYNGKSFDWPHVKSRHAFLRKFLPKLPETGHIDLLHAARRLWKDELPSCRLAIVEEHKLKKPRVGDTPGSLAPLLYMDFVRERDPAILAGIIEHNDQDVRSLVTLYVLLAEKVLGYSHTEIHEHEKIAKWYETLKLEEKAEYHYKEAITRAVTPSREAHFRLGKLYKKQKRYQEAKHELHQAIATALPHTDALLELAKLYEHQEKDVDMAYKLTKLASKSVLKKQEASVATRLNRLQRKREGKK
ncbi:ribonuclease H-like domain-containing protein [Paenalkalicoccus suaedae]|uniref:Ribonuclease H-like domain-containing protein n=1 Tax=Paenalkalicoccus suaedae TaxID=2592382 RepID=A0A859FDM9_9BACI|nr:ribonuclease H-like domain-containing protein [Paenalkalicoccus suaedae]QKS71309.1 ribonuclease H-like domain-containing protein [Paenalkalicoccus suaedae]